MVQCLQADSKIVADEDKHLVRYNGDGTKDASFATQQDGQFRRDTSALAVQGDGKIIVTGANTLPDYVGGVKHCLGSCPPDAGALVIERYNPDGTPDATFGSVGTVMTGFDGNVNYRIALQPDGRIVLTGSGYDNSNLVLRYLP